MQQMQGLDAVFVAMEQPSAPVHIGSVMIYDPSTAPGGFVRFKDILSFIESRLQLSSTMRQKMVKVPFSIDYPYWVQDIDFDLEFHVRHVALPKPGDQRQLNIQAARIFARPLDLSRPPWELTVIEGLDNVEGVPPGSYAIVSKVHHAAIDGASGVDMMQALHTLTPNSAAPDTMDMWKPESNPSQTELFARGYGRSLMLPLRQMNATRKALPGMARAVKGFLAKEFDVKAILETPKTRFNGVVSPHRMFGAKAFNIKEINKIRVLSEGSKLNDVMLSITGGAMRHYLEAHNELPDTSVTAMAPISVRAEKERNTMGNQVAAMFVPLGSHIECPHKRVKYVHAETKKAKGLTDAMGARQTAEIAKLASAPAMTLGANLMTRFKLADRVKPFINTVVTNVPGPRVPLYQAGAQAVGVYGMLCLVDGMRLGHVVQSYTDQITLSFTACRDALPDPDFYIECIQKSFEEHAAAALEVQKQLETAAVAAPAAKKAAKPSKPVKAVKTKTVHTAKPAAVKTNGGAKPEA